MQSAQQLDETESIRMQNTERMDDMECVTDTGCVDDLECTEDKECVDGVEHAEKLTLILASKWIQIHLPVAGRVGAGLGCHAKSCNNRLTADNLC